MGLSASLHQDLNDRIMTEENPSLEVIVKDLASTVTLRASALREKGSGHARLSVSLQEEISGLKKEGTVDAPRRQNKRSRDDGDVDEAERDSETHHTRDGESSKDDKVPSDAEGNTPAAYAVSTEGEAFLETTFGSKLDYAARRKQVDKIGAPDTKWVKTPVLPPVMASILPRTQ